MTTVCEYDPRVIPFLPGSVGRPSEPTALGHRWPRANAPLAPGPALALVGQASKVTGESCDKHENGQDWGMAMGE